LRLVYDPRPGVTAATPSFRFEIRSAYRVGGSDVDRTTVALALTVNQRERTILGAQTYLAQLGMALESDPTRSDHLHRPFPRRRPRHRLRHRPGHLQEPRLVVPGGYGSGARAVRGARRIRGRPHVDLRPRRALRPGAPRDGQLHRLVPEGAERVHAAAARLRTVVELHRRREYGAALPARVRHAGAQRP